MNQLSDLLRAITRVPALTDWTARATTSTTAWLHHDAAGQRRGEQTAHELAGELHRDVAAGRGSSAFVVGPNLPLADVIADAAARALATVGPSWRSSPPAALARVAVADPDLPPADISRFPDLVVEDLTNAAQAAGATLESFDIAVNVGNIRVASSRGLRAAWNTSLVTLEATIIRGTARVDFRRQARRRRDLALGEALTAALDRADRQRSAQPLATGRYAVVAHASAFLHRGYGLLAALVAQTDPSRERLGLVTYRPGQPIAPGATTIANPLTVSSDGAMPFGLHSAPLTDQAEPVRRFELIARGVARGLALTARESSLRGVEPNGGVRNLVVAAGDIAARELLQRSAPVLLVESLDWLDVDPVTGRFRAGVALATFVHGTQRTDVTGGTLRGDAIAALALGRRSQETHATDEYRGPAWWELGHLLVD